jgi:hypothetical protein
VKIRGYHDDVAASDAERAVSKHRWSSFQHLQEEMDRLCDAGRQSWTYDTTDYDESYNQLMKHLIQLWEVTSMAWLQNDYHIMRGTVSKAGETWSAANILRTIVPATRLAIATIEANRAYRLKGQAFERAMMRGRDHAVTALQELSKMERTGGEPLVTALVLHVDANLLVYVMGQELNDAEQCQRVANAVNEEYLRHGLVLDLAAEANLVLRDIKTGSVMDPRVIA